MLVLIKKKYKKDEIGQMVPIESKREVFCNLSSVSASEWFEAGRNDLNPEYRATVFAYDYEGEKIAEIDGEPYGIYRSYIRNGEEIELYLEKKAGI